MQSTQKSPESTHTSNRARTNSQDSGDMMLPPQVGKGSPSRRAADARRTLWSSDKINQAAEAHRAEKATQAQQGQTSPQGAAGPQAESDNPSAQLQPAPAPNASTETMQSPAGTQNQSVDTPANTAADQSIAEGQDRIGGGHEGEEATQCPDLVYQPISSAIAAQFEKCTGENVSGVLIAENPELEEMGKRGVAKDGRCVEVVPGCLSDVELCAHELTHIVQQRGPFKSLGESEVNQSAEEEAIESSKIVVAGKFRRVKVKSSAPMLFDDNNPKGDCHTSEHESDQSHCTSKDAQPGHLNTPVSLEGTSQAQGKLTDVVPLPPMPNYMMKQEANWRKIVEAASGDKGDFVNTVFREVPLIREILQDIGGHVSMTLSRPVTTGAVAHMEMAPETEAWFRESFKVYKAQAEMNGCVLEDDNANAQAVNPPEVHKTACTDGAIVKQWIAALENSTIQIPTEKMQVIIAIKSERATFENLDTLVLDSIHELEHAQQHLSGLNQKKFLRGFPGYITRLPINESAEEACYAKAASEAEATGDKPRTGLCKSINDPDTYLETEQLAEMNNEKSKQEIEAYSVEAFIADLYKLPDSEGFGVINNAFKMHEFWKKMTPEAQKDVNVILAIRAQTKDLFPNIYKNWEMQWLIEIVNEISKQGDLLLAYQTFSDNLDLNALVQDVRFQKVIFYIQENKDKITKIDKALAEFLSKAELYRYQSKEGVPEFTRLSLIEHLATHIFNEAWLNEQEAKHPLLYGREYNAISILNTHINHAARTWQQRDDDDKKKLIDIPAAHYNNPDPFIGTFVQFGDSGSVIPNPNSLKNLNPFMDSVSSALEGGGQIDHIEVRGFSDKEGDPASEKSTALKRAKAIRDYLRSEFKDILQTQSQVISIQIEGEAYVDGQCDQDLAQVDPYGYGQACRKETSLNEDESPDLLQTKHRVVVIKVIGEKK